MVVDEYKTILQWHPELILVSENPVTWQGFLTVAGKSNSGHGTRIKLKLTVPNYPYLRYAEVNFGKKIALLSSKEFTMKVAEIMRSATKVSIFLRHLQRLIDDTIRNTYTEDTAHGLTDIAATKILKELKDTFKISSDVRLLSDSSLDTIKLSLKNVSLKLRRTKHSDCPWAVISSDLPEIPAFGPFERNVTTLSLARNKFKLQVETLEKTWASLKQIDEKCWVVDPVEPKPHHLYRRIHLTHSLSMFVKIDPLNPEDLPEIKFLGSENEVEAQRDIVSNNIHNWNPRCSILENLTMLLSIEMFPQKEKIERMKDRNAVFDDSKECCICYNECQPEKICSSEKCRRHFHIICLRQWLQSVPDNHVAFDHIHGACPQCNESISCPIE